MKSKRLAFLMIVLSMVIFGTIGVARRLIPLGSATLAAVRGYVGTLVLLLILAIRKTKPDFRIIRAHLPVLVLSGAAIGVNWIFLFEAFERTTVAVATLCYYMAPVFVIIGSSLFFREAFTLKKAIVVAVATAGMVGVSGVLGGNLSFADLDGILFGLAAALLYASVMLLNQKLKPVGAFDKTVIQLFVAALAVTPYALLTETVPEGAFAPVPLLLTLAVGIVHTGLAYAMYFGAMRHFGAQTVALVSYIDPIVAVLLSVTLLGEPMGVPEILGVALILGATLLGELTPAVETRKNQNTDSENQNG